MNDLVEAVRAAYRGPEPWNERLLSRLAAMGWADLAQASLDADSYSTARALARSPSPPRRLLAILPTGGSAQETLNVEIFGGPVPPRYADLGIVEARCPRDRISASLRPALEVLAGAPASTAPVALARSLHLLTTDHPDTDVSYSDPEVPFSVFIGLHPEPVALERMRLAEGLLHESLHLALSLAERVVPIVDGDGPERYSPWKREPRPSQGLAHGLFVFRGIQSFMREAARGGTLDDDERRHARDRIALIESEVCQIADLYDDPGLTSDGEALMRSLLGDGLSAR